MLKWKAELWYSDNRLIESTVAARDLRDATEAAWLAWRELEAAGELRRSRPAGEIVSRGALELADRITVSLMRV